MPLKLELARSVVFPDPTGYHLNCLAHGEESTRWSHRLPGPRALLPELSVSNNFTSSGSRSLHRELKSNEGMRRDTHCFIDWGQLRSKPAQPPSEKQRNHRGLSAPFISNEESGRRDRPNVITICHWLVTRRSIVSSGPRTLKPQSCESMLDLSMICAMHA